MFQDTNSEFYIQKDKKRGKRMHQKNKIKNKTKKRIKENFKDVSWSIDKIVGIESKTPQRCSSYCCGNPRKYFKELSLKETQNLYNYQEQLTDLFLEE